MAQRIKELAKRRGLSLNFVADFSGISRGYLSRILSGERNPTLKVIEQIATALKVRVRDLFPE